jgi:HEAT repeat protein
MFFTKNRRRKKMKTAATLLMVGLFVAMTMSQELGAQSSNYKNITKNSIVTLKEGIQSENPGVRKSSIYMAGLYKIEEAVDVLTKEIRTEKDANIKVLIALSLYNIGDPKGMEAVKALSENDQDLRVKRMSTALYQAYIENAVSISQR